MALETLTVKKAVEMSLPIARRLFRKFVSPIIEERVLKVLETKQAYNKFKADSERYIAKVSGSCSVMNTIAFQNSPKKLEDVYLPLNLKTSSGREICVDKEADLFVESSRILVVDNAGMGKSTISKRVVMNVVNEETAIPVFFEMRRFESSPLVEQLGSKLGLDVKVCYDVLKELELVCVFDGLDETPGNLISEAVEEINDFSVSFHNAKILITSRSESYLSGFYDFDACSINKLGRDEALRLLEKYDPDEVFSKSLVQEVKSSRQGGVHEFLSTPLYVSLLFCAYRHKSIIPHKRNSFYSQVYEALFESHDLSKEAGYIREKYCGLDSTSFHSVLRRLGFWCLKNDGRINFQKDELEIVVKEISGQMSEVDVIAEDYVKDLTSTVPLFVKEGSLVSWSHKSLMEYFASMFICYDVKDEREGLLGKLYRSERAESYVNVLDLCSDIDYSSFRGGFVKLLLDDFVEYCSDAYLDITNKRVSKSSIKFRKGLSFSNCLEFAYCCPSKDINKDWLKDNINKLVGEPGGLAIRISGVAFKESSVPLLFRYRHGIARKLLPIIKKKNESLFFDEEWDSGQVVESLVGSSLQDEFFHKVDDSPKRKINNSANFDVVSGVLAINSPFALNIDNVIDEVKAIKEDQSDGVDGLLSGF